MPSLDSSSTTTTEREDSNKQQQHQEDEHELVAWTIASMNSSSSKEGEGLFIVKKQEQDSLGTHALHQETTIPHNNTQHGTIENQAPTSLVLNSSRDHPPNKESSQILSALTLKNSSRKHVMSSSSSESESALRNQSSSNNSGSLSERTDSKKDAAVGTLWNSPPASSSILSAPPFHPSHYHHHHYDPRYYHYYYQPYYYPPPAQLFDSPYQHDQPSNRIEETAKRKANSECTQDDDSYGDKKSKKTKHEEFEHKDPKHRVINNHDSPPIRSDSLDISSSTAEEKPKEQYPNDAGVHDSQPPPLPYYNASSMYPPPPPFPPPHYHSGPIYYYHHPQHAPPPYPYYGYYYPPPTGTAMSHYYPSYPPPPYYSHVPQPFPPSHASQQKPSSSSSSQEENQATPTTPPPPHAQHPQYYTNYPPPPYYPYPPSHHLPPSIPTSSNLNSEPIPVATAPIVCHYYRAEEKDASATESTTSSSKDSNELHTVPSIMGSSLGHQMVSRVETQNQSSTILMEIFSQNKFHIESGLGKTTDSPTELSRKKNIEKKKKVEIDDNNFTLFEKLREGEGILFRRRKKVLTKHNKTLDKQQNAGDRMYARFPNISNCCGIAKHIAYNGSRAGKGYHYILKYRPTRSELELFQKHKDDNLTMQIVCSNETESSANSSIFGSLKNSKSNAPFKVYTTIGGGVSELPSKVVFDQGLQVVECAFRIEKVGEQRRGVADLNMNYKFIIRTANNEDALSNHMTAEETTILLSSPFKLISKDKQEDPCTSSKDCIRSRLHEGNRKD
ncbi:hypothetical protein C9374_004995 [Naegleria lovaniensis]|uniref:Uncharacterized protein n=1 Tax=Naegleria lovaniensis TaxID=51637 RepID=A0AA88KKI0_NAELO|nr:uncharacterized protein C9374_004995 [Naegleria lovaniensis]KAG2383028.1 hypothetical protein C9374_004995 [Naegleria lovaniensis]